jgi:hypothetical protein
LTTREYVRIIKKGGDPSNFQGILQEIVIRWSSSHISPSFNRKCPKEEIKRKDKYDAVIARPFLPVYSTKERDIKHVFDPIK